MQEKRNMICKFCVFVSLITLSTPFLPWTSLLITLTPMTSVQLSPPSAFSPLPAYLLFVSTSSLSNTILSLSFAFPSSISSLILSRAEVVVEYDYDALHDDELTLRPGDIIKNVRYIEEDGWMEGDLNGKRGLFPDNFVKVRRRSMFIFRISLCCHATYLIILTSGF